MLTNLIPTHAVSTLVVTMVALAACGIPDSGGKTPDQAAGADARPDIGDPGPARPATPGTGTSTATATGSEPAPANGQDARTQPVKCPRYPVVLHHGFMAGAKVGGFAGAKDHFQKLGCKLLETEVAAVQTSEYRAGQLKTQIEGFLRATGAEKVHIIAHSQGGLDARYAISVLGMAPQIASLSTMSTPHQGTPLADLALKQSGPLAQRALAAMLNLFGSAISNNTPDPDTLAAVRSLTVEYMTGTFNPQVKDVPGVLYQSWSAASGRGTGDQLKAMMVIAHGLLAATAGANDGVVPEESGKWGKVRGTLDADHLDLIGMQMMDGAGSPFKLLPFLDVVLTELAAQGL